MLGVLLQLLDVSDPFLLRLPCSCPSGDAHQHRRLHHGRRQHLSAWQLSEQRNQQESRGHTGLCRLLHYSGYVHI